MKSKSYLVTGKDLREMKLDLREGKNHLPDDKVVTKKELVTTYYATCETINDDARCAEFTRIEPINLEIRLFTRNYEGTGKRVDVTDELANPEYCDDLIYDDAEIVSTRPIREIIYRGYAREKEEEEITSLEEIYSFVAYPITSPKILLKLDYNKLLEESTIEKTPNEYCYRLNKCVLFPNGKGNYLEIVTTSYSRKKFKGNFKYDPVKLIINSTPYYVCNGKKIVPNKNIDFKTIKYKDIKKSLFTIEPCPKNKYFKKYLNEFGAEELCDNGFDLLASNLGVLVGKSKYIDELNSKIVSFLKTLLNDFYLKNRKSEDNIYYLPKNVISSFYIYTDKSEFPSANIEKNLYGIEGESLNFIFYNTLYSPNILQKVLDRENSGELTEDDLVLYYILSSCSYYSTFKDVGLYEIPDWEYDQLKTIMAFPITYRKNIELVMRYQDLAYNLMIKSNNVLNYHRSLDYSNGYNKNQLSTSKMLLGSPYLSGQRNNYDVEYDRSKLGILKYFSVGLKGSAGYFVGKEILAGYFDFLPTNKKHTPNIIYRSSTSNNGISDSSKYYIDIIIFDLDIFTIRYSKSDHMSSLNVAYVLLKEKILSLINYIPNEYIRYSHQPQNYTIDKRYFDTFTYATEEECLKMVKEIPGETHPVPQDTIMLEEETSDFGTAPAVTWGNGISITGFPLCKVKYSKVDVDKFILNFELITNASSNNLEFILVDPGKNRWVKVDGTIIKSKYNYNENNYYERTPATGGQTFLEPIITEESNGIIKGYFDLKKLPSFKEIAHGVGIRIFHKNDKYYNGQIWNSKLEDVSDAPYWIDNSKQGYESIFWTDKLEERRSGRPFSSGFMNTSYLPIEIVFDVPVLFPTYNFSFNESISVSYFENTIPITISSNKSYYDGFSVPVDYTLTSSESWCTISGHNLIISENSGEPRRCEITATQADSNKKIIINVSQSSWNITFEIDTPYY